MLEKKPGTTLIEKIRAISLMKAYSNASYKEIFGNDMLDEVISHNFMPEEIYSKHGKNANKCSLSKVIIYDIVPQARISAALSSIDDTNCYDSIAHAIALLFFQSIGVSLEAVEPMLTEIE